MEKQILREKQKMSDTKELDLWRGEFGDNYRQRNKIDQELLISRAKHWGYNLNAIAAFGSVKNLPKSILEVGCGSGINLLAIKEVYDQNNEMVHIMACEPNEITRTATAVECGSRFMFPTWLPKESTAEKLIIESNSVELAFTSGVLIHIHPDNQLRAMKELYRASQKYIICMEYFSPDLQEKTYHDKQALWTRDYGSLWLDNFKLRALACYFSWKPITKLDNITTWIFEKVN